ncbi:MAG: glycosyltransferase [Candidatus Nanoarchaeia archaeon]|jgi:GT2 family glycosyltransferase|nr:glycosyltransferase [Candidatus Nanoarchaeia archaeon]
MLIYWEGYGGTKYLAENLRPLIEQLNCKLITMSEWEDSDIIWDLSTWLQELKKADVVIIPCNYLVQNAKSNNRLTQMMSLGKPCIVNPLPAYLKIIEENPGCALIATTEEDWKKHIEYLKDSEHRNQLSQKALIAAQKYSIKNIAQKWIDIFENKKEDIKNDVIIPTYNNVEYLRLCLDSLKRNSAFKNRIIISDAGSNATTWEYYKTINNVEILGTQDVRLNFSQACNAGIQNSSSDYFVLLNSDTIVSKNWDVNLVSKLQADPQLAMCGVLSNCDRFWLHGVPGKPVYPMSIPGLELVPGMKASQLEGKLDSLYSFMDNSNKSHQGTLVEQEWVAFYCTMFNRKKFNEIGLLDITFNNGCEDLDFCIRTKKMNYKIAQAIDCFVFHFGGISRGSYEKEFL